MPDRRNDPLRFHLAWVLALSLGACSGGEKPETMPSQTLTQVAPQLATPPPPPPPPIREVQPTRPSVKVIDVGGDADQPKSLAEASRLAKSRKSRTRDSIAVINDENLHEFAQGAEVIIVEGPPAVPDPEPEPLAAAAADDGVRDEQYWRSKALEIRMGWRRTLDRIADLELE